MVFYTIAAIALALGINQETIRRWIRKGELEAEQDSRKGGNKISEESIKKFLSSHPKYAEAAEASTTLSHIVKETQGQVILERTIDDLGSIKLNEAEAWLEEARSMLAEKEQEVTQLKEQIATLEAILTVWNQNKKDGENA